MGRKTLYETAMDDAIYPYVRKFFAEEIPFNRYVGLEILKLEKGTATVKLPFRPELVGDPFRPALHGGAIATLLDTTGGAAVWTELTPTDRVSTVDIRVDYLRPGRLEELHAEGCVRRVGNRMGVVAIRAYHPSHPDETIAEAMAVYNIRRENDAR